jgi:TRAF3-interacting protein 1
MEDFWKPTSEMFSSLFEKPKMSEKLLVKPPFKYIFDIIMETTKATGLNFKYGLGYGKGLYVADELDGNSYQNKEKKLVFLQKIIDLT